MAVKKVTKKTVRKPPGKASPRTKSKPKTAAKTAAKKTGKKTAAKKTAAKKTAAKKTAARKPATSRKETGTRQARASKALSQQTSEKPASPDEKGAPKRTLAAGEFSSLNVNMGQILALRPRVAPSFRQPDFLNARLHLQEDSFGSVEEAARAVAEEALKLTRDGPPKRGFRRRGGPR